MLYAHIFLIAHFCSPFSSERVHACSPDIFWVAILYAKLSCDRTVYTGNGVTILTDLKESKSYHKQLNITY